MRRPLPPSRLASKSLERQPAAVSSSLRDIRPADCLSVRLSFQQQRIHVLSRLDPTGYNYHVIEAVRLSGPLDVDALEASIATICERHEVLRSTFLDRLGEPMQIVGSARSAVERRRPATVREEQASSGDSAQRAKLVRQSSTSGKSRLCYASCCG